MSSRWAGPQYSRLCQEPGAHVNVARRHQVVQGAQAGVQGDVLKGAGDAQLGDAMRRQAREVVPFKDDLPSVRVVEVVDAVEHRGLARAVGADDGQDLALPGVETDAGQGLDPPEA